MFSRLRRGGLSLQCGIHAGEECAKDIGYTPEVNEAEAVRRLLAWGFAQKVLRAMSTWAAEVAVSVGL